MSIRRHLARVGGLSAIIFLLGSTFLYPQTGFNRLAAAKRVECVFTSYTSGTWTNGEVKTETKPASLSLKFESIDAEDGVAEVVSDYGKVHIIAKVSLWSLHFLEMGSEGALRVTTVFDKENRPGKFKAAHTRHEYTDVSLPGFTSRPEQYYGECEIHR
jgi:hypothetical protein